MTPKTDRFWFIKATGLNQGMLNPTPSSFSMPGRRDSVAARATAELARQEAVLDLYNETLMHIATQAADDAAALQRPRAIEGALRAKLDEFLARPEDDGERAGGLLEAVTLQLQNLNDIEGSLEVGSRYLAHLATHGDDPRKVVSAYAMQGLALCRLRRAAECEAVLRKGLARSAGAGDDPELRRRRLEVTMELVEGLMYSGKRQEAGDLLSRAQREVSRGSPDELAAAEVEVGAARFWAGFAEARTLAAARRADMAFERRNAGVQERTWTLEELGRALLADGQAAAAEAALRRSLAFAVPSFGRGSDIVTQLVTGLADTVAAQGRYREAGSLVEAQAEAVGPSPSIPNQRLLLAGRWSVALLAGDVATAAALAPPVESPVFGPELENRNATLLMEKAQTLLFIGRGREARDFMDIVRARWVGAGQPSARYLRMLAMLTRTQLAAGDPGAARTTAQALVASYTREQASAGAGWREANELLALACAHQGDGAAAQAALSAAGAGSAHYRSPVDRAESTLDRAEALAALGRGSEARALANAAISDLRGQSSDSPRLARARRLASMTT